MFGRKNPRSGRGMIHIRLALGGNVFNSSEMAAWVQAIGSVFAIFVAILIAFFQGHSSRKMLQSQRAQESERAAEGRKNLLRSRVYICERIADAALNTCGHITGAHASVQEEAATAGETMREAMLVLKEIPLSNFPETFVAADVINLRLVVGRLVSTLDEISRGGSVQELHRDSLGKIYDQVKKLKTSLSEIADKYDGEWSVVRRPEV